MSALNKVSIAGFPNYWVTRDGEVISKGRWGKPQALRKFYMKGRLPYAYVNLHADKKMRTCRVAVLICEAFHGPRPSDKHEAAHRNGIHNDDRADNLRWATKIENAADRRLHGTQIQGSSVNNAKLTDDFVRLIRATSRHYGNQIELARRFNVSRSTIARVQKNKTWRHV